MGFFDDDANVPDAPAGGSIAARIGAAKRELFYLGRAAQGAGEAGVAQTCLRILDPPDPPVAGNATAEEMGARLGACMDGSFPMDDGAAMRVELDDCVARLALLYRAGLALGMPLTDDARSLLA